MIRDYFQSIRLPQRRTGRIKYLFIRVDNRYTSFIYRFPEQLEGGQPPMKYFWTKYSWSVVFCLAIAVNAFSADSVEKKGSFGVVVRENFVKFSYVLTYLGNAYKEDHIAFQIDFDDSKGYDISNEIDENETILKDGRNNTIQGKVERKTASSSILIFPVEKTDDLKGQAKLYTRIMGYRLKQTFKI